MCRVQQRKLGQTIDDLKKENAALRKEVQDLRTRLKESNAIAEAVHPKRAEIRHEISTVNVNATANDSTATGSSPTEVSKSRMTASAVE